MSLSSFQHIRHHLSASKSRNRVGHAAHDGRKANEGLNIAGYA